jgi:2,5-diamino-6-(ribosylamino)-4(3H)-pyrimidinone 5'-phosphate reductase
VLPHVIVHNEMSLDARMDGLEVDMGRYYALAGRWHEDCTLVGSTTLLSALPALAEAEWAGAPEDAEGPAPRRAEVSSDAPLLAVVDSRGRLPGLARIRRQPYWRDVVSLGSAATPAKHLERLEATNVRYITSGEERIDLRLALEALAERHGVRVVRVDAGGALVGALLRAGLVAEVSVVIEPRLVGGESHRWLVRAPDAGAGDVVMLSLRKVEQFDDDVLWLRYQVATR